MVALGRTGRSMVAAALGIALLVGCGGGEKTPAPSGEKSPPVKAAGEAKGTTPDGGTAAKTDPKGTTPPTGTTKSGTTPTDPFLDPKGPATPSSAGTGGTTPKGGAETAADLSVVGEEFVLGLLIRPGAITRAPSVTGTYAALSKDLDSNANELVEQANLARSMSGLEPGDVDQILVLADLDALKGLATLGAGPPRRAGPPEVITRPASDGTDVPKGTTPDKSEKPVPPKTDKPEAKPQDGAPKADAARIDLRFAPDGTSFVAFEQPAAEPAPPTAKPQPGATDPGEDPAPPAPFAIPGRVGLMLHASKPIDRTKLDEFLPPEAPSKEHAGQKYQLVGPFAVCLVGDRTLLAGNEAGLKHMLDARSAKPGPLRQQFQSAADHQFVLALQVDRVTDLITQASQALGPAGFVALAYGGQFKRVTLALDLSGPSLASLHAEMINADSAANFAPIFQSGLTDARTKFAAAKQDPESKEYPGVVKLVDDVLARSTVRADGAHLRVEVPMPAGFDQLAEALAPMIERARKAAERSRRMNDLRQIGLALHFHHGAQDRMPSADGPGRGAETPKEQEGKLSWRVHLLPFLEEQDLFAQFKLDEPWDGPTNKPLIAKMPKVFGQDPDGRTRYHVIVGAKSGSAFAKPGGTKFDEVTDGTSQTLGVVEAGPDKAEFWTKPGGLEFDPATSTVASLLGNVGDEFLLMLLDGSVQTRTAKLAPELLKAMITFAGGENSAPGDLPKKTD